MIGKDDFDIEAFSGGDSQCATCVWAFVFGGRPAERCCGKYSVKPKQVYYKGAPCKAYVALKNVSGVKKLP